MYLEKTTAMSLSFQLSYEQIRQAHEIYERHCFSCDFISRCQERKMDNIGLCNLPYETLSDEAELLDTAYMVFCKMNNANVAYNDIVDMVIDEIEQQIADGTFTSFLRMAPFPFPDTMSRTYWKQKK